MTKVTSLTTLVLTSLLAGACTVTIGEKFDDDDADFVDDSDFVNDSDEDASNNDTTDTTQTSEEETSSDPTDTATETTDAGGTGTVDAGGQSSSTGGDTTSTQDTSSSEPVNPGDPFAGQCEPPGEPYSCAECLLYHCSQVWANCCEDDTCVATWNEITTCVANPMSDEPIDDVDRCAAEASPTGDQLDLSDEVQAVMWCVGMEFMGDDDLYGHQPGEGTCTLYCYGAEAIYTPQD